MMTSREIKEELSKKGISQVSIARRFDCSKNNIWQLFHHTATKDGQPSLIRNYIADTIGKTFKEVWE